jgi:hypothetical protein
MSGHQAPDGYEGDAVLTVADGSPRSAHAALAARFDPLAGHVVWTGRVAAQLPPGTALAITTPHGTGSAVATETDAWGNTRLTGQGRPPFPVELLDGDAASG